MEHRRGGAVGEGEEDEEEEEVSRLTRMAHTSV